jgi:hypothetical protein
MTSAQRDAIANPATGLFIFNTTLGCFQIQMGTPATPNWNCVTVSNAFVTSINCGAAVQAGHLAQGTAASGVSVTVPYAGGNGGFYTGQVVNSTNVTGLTASIAPGNLLLGSGIFTVNIAGTPASSGTANFALNIAGQSCTLALTVYPALFFNCSDYVVSQTPNEVMVNGTTYTGTVSIPYVNGNGQSYGVVSVGPNNGITLTRVAGTYAANGGSGNIVYTISGTYSGVSNSLLSFSLSEGCNISLGCGGTYMRTHTTGDGVTPVNKTVGYGTVWTNLSGTNQCWITRNLGASQQATGVGDATEASAGWYWQFNRKQGYMHDGTTRTPNTAWITPIDENSDWLISNEPCNLLLGTGWRLPTLSEWTNVKSGWTTWTPAYNSVLKLHASGWLDTNTGSLSLRGTLISLYSSQQNLTTSGWYIGALSNNCYINSLVKSTGSAVRCLRN